LTWFPASFKALYRCPIGISATRESPDATALPISLLTGLKRRSLPFQLPLLLIQLP
jgi:hypothetical protein